MTAPTPDMLASDRDLEEVRWALLRQRADICLDAGLEQEAAGWRWLAKYKKWPLYFDGGYEWRWHSYSDGDNRSKLPIHQTKLPGGAWRYWDDARKLLGDYGDGSLAATLRRAAIAIGAWLAAQPTTPPAQRRRTRAEVLAAQRQIPLVGCCERYAHSLGCNCLEEAEG